MRDAPENGRHIGRGTVARAGVPATTMPAPSDEDRPAEERGAAERRGRSRPGIPTERKPRREAADGVGGRARLGEEAIEDRADGADVTRPARSATFVPNSSVCGAIRSVLASATSRPKTTRPTRPVGTVFGSVIMKKRKISTSGDVTTTRQKSTPQTGAKAQFAVMQ